MFNRPFGWIIAICTVAASVAASPEAIATNGLTSIEDRPIALDSPRSVALVPTTVPSRFVVVKNIKLQVANPIVGDDTPAATLKFDIYNELAQSITDVVVAVSILGQRTATDSESRSLLVRPFKIRLPQMVEPSYSVHYEVRMKNLAGDCDCVPQIEVVEARVVAATDALLRSND